VVKRRRLSQRGSEVYPSSLPYPPFDLVDSEPKTADGGERKKRKEKKKKKEKKPRTEVSFAPSLATVRHLFLTRFGRGSVTPSPFNRPLPPPSSSPYCPSPHPPCLSPDFCFLSLSNSAGCKALAVLPCVPHFLTFIPDINDHLAFQLAPLFMDAESLFASQYSTNWTTSPVSRLLVHNRSSTSSIPNLPPPRSNSSSSSTMLNTPISRASPSMPHPMSSSVDSHTHLQSFTSSEFSGVFSTPLDPDTFAALAASGMLQPPLSQPLHPASEPIRNPYGVQPSPFLPTSASHIVDGQYPSKLSSYSHTIPNSGPQIKSKQTIVRRIAYFQ